MAMYGIVPTSVVITGSGSETQSTNANGGIDFANVTAIALNGVFTSTYNTYRIVSNFVSSESGAVAIFARLRAAGSDATGSNYNRQYATAYSTTKFAARESSQDSWVITSADPSNSDMTMDLYGPQQAQPTSFRSVNAYARDGSRIWDLGGTHSLSTSYDGITIFPTSGIITGTIRIFGLEE